MKPFLYTRSIKESSMTLPPTPLLPPNNLRHTQHKTNTHNHSPKRNTHITPPTSPMSVRFVKIHESIVVGEYKLMRTSGRGADEFEDDAYVAGDEGDSSWRIRLRRW